MTLYRFEHLDALEDAEELLSVRRRRTVVGVGTGGDDHRVGGRDIGHCAPLR